MISFKLGNFLKTYEAENMKNIEDMISDTDKNKMDAIDLIVSSPNEKLIQKIQQMLHPGRKEEYYFRVRGHKITRELAFEIIRRTDVKTRTLGKHSDYIDTFQTLNNNWFSTLENKEYKGNGWIKPSGVVGYNSKIEHFETLSEVLVDLAYYIINFSYLDFVMAVTDWDRVPSEIDGSTLKNEDNWDFNNHIEFMIQVSNRIIWIYSKEDAQKIYEDYQFRYEAKVKNYYSSLEQSLIPPSYFEKCMEVNNSIAYVDKTIPYYDLAEHCWKCEFPERKIKKEEGNIEYIVGEFLRSGLIYHARLDNEVTHEHSFSAVLEMVIDNFETISFDGFEDEYSKQELDIINNLISKLKIKKQASDLEESK